MPIEIKNLLFQPLCLHLAGDGSKSLHLNPREKRLIQPEEVSEEIRRAEKRGSIALTDTGSRPVQEAPAPARTGFPAPGKNGRPRRGGR